MKKMKRQPTHPGKIIREDYLMPLSITIKDMASTLGVSRKTLSKIINEKGSITPDMALRLSRAFDTTPDLWLTLQKTMIYGRQSMSQKHGKRSSPFHHNCSIIKDKTAPYTQRVLSKDSRWPIIPPAYTTLRLRTTACFKVLTGLVHKCS